MAAAVAVAGAGAAGGLVLSGAFASPSAEGAGSDPSLPARTDVVTRQDLVDTAAQDGTLGYGEEHPLTNGRQGTVTWVPEAGQVVARGEALYRVDDAPVVLMYGELPAYRALGVGVEGADVKQFERQLRKLGYSGFTVDEEYTAATAGAVEDWQEDLGVEETGTVAPGDVAYAAGPVRVASVELGLGAAAPPGQAALRWTGTGRVVTVDLPVADQRLARTGAAVTVELPGGATVPGRVTDVGTVATTPDDPDAGSDDATVAVTVALTGKVAGDAAAVDRSPVEVEFTARERRGVLTVPVAALVALREGGYGVQVVSGGTARYVVVGTGLFADGRVEVTGDGLAAGTKVGVPGA